MDHHPDPDTPHATKWDGYCIYDSMTADCATHVLDWPPAWPNPDAWMGLRVQALYQAAKYNNKQLIWTIGGAADLTQFMDDNLCGRFAYQIA